MEYRCDSRGWMFLLGCLLPMVMSSFAKAEYPAVYPPKDERRVSYACQDSYIHLSCKRPGERIRILLANYGRFSLVVCNQDGIHNGWDTQCTSLKSMQVVGERCDGHTNCTFIASNKLFGDPCPDTKKYIEVRYHCEQAVDAKNETDPMPEHTTDSVLTPSTPVEEYTQMPDSGGVTEQMKKKKQCPRTEMGSVYWPPTDHGVLVEKSCPNEMRGYALYQCGRDGEWVGEPDLNACVSPWIVNIKEMLKSQKEPAVKTLGKLNSDMKEKKMGAGDLREASTSLIPGLVAKISAEVNDKGITWERKRELVHSFNKEIVKTGSGLLEDKQQATWARLSPEVRRKSATSLIISMEQMALEVAATINDAGRVSSSEQNIVMEVNVIKMVNTKLMQNLELPIMQYDTGASSQHDFTLPLDGLSGISDSDDITVTYLFYNNLESLMNPSGMEVTLTESNNSTRVINTNIVSASIMKHSVTATKAHRRMDLKRPMNFTLAHKHKMTDKVPHCAYWNYNESSLIGQWSEDGCRVVETNDEFTTCQCNHLTNFAVLFDVAGTELHLLHEMSLRAITYVGCTVSIICLLMCFISFSMFRNLQSDRNTIHKNLVMCLMIAELLFLFGIGQTEDKIACSIIAAFLHFFFLTSFSWMCLEGIQLYFMLIEVFEAERSRVRWFYAFGYGVPALVVAISAGADHTGYGTDKHCWLRTDNYFILSFVIPAAVVILINIAMLSIAVYMMCRHAGVTASAIKSRQKGKLEKMGRDEKKYSIASDSSVKTPREMPTWLKGSALLVVLLGLTWIFGFMYVNADTIIMAYIFTILNSLQGLFIFIFHCFMDRKVKKEWRRAIYKAKWLPVCCRVNLGGYNGHLSSPTPTSSSGPQNYFLRFWSSRKRKRSTSSNSNKRRSDLDSFLRSDTSSGCTTGTGVKRYSNQSDKLLPNGQNPYSAMPTHYEGGVIGDLSVVDGSVIDSEYVTEYCNQHMQVSNEKRRYSSGSEDDTDNRGIDNVSHDSISKNRLSLLSTDTASKINSECTSDNEERKEDFAVLENGRVKMFKNYETGDSENDRNLLNDILNLYENVKGKNGTSLVPSERICSSQDELDSKTENSAEAKCKTKSAPDLKNHTVNVSYVNPVMDTSTQPLLGSLPDLSTIGEEDADIDTNPCSKSEILRST